MSYIYIIFTNSCGQFGLSCWKATGSGKTEVLEEIRRRRQSMTGAHDWSCGVRLARQKLGQVINLEVHHMCCFHGLDHGLERDISVVGGFNGHDAMYFSLCGALKT